MIELRLLTEEAKRTRFDFVWTFENCPHPVMFMWEGEWVLRHALERALQMHGALDFGLADMGSGYWPPPEQIFPMNRGLWLVDGKRE